jgi:uncharacterized LabA/DUF88 family protein
MSFQYYGYSGMPATLYESFAAEDLVRAKQQLKQYTDPYIPKITENKFIYTGTEKNQILNERPILQRSLIEDFQMPVFEYIGRVKHIEPRPNYIVNVDVDRTINAKYIKPQTDYDFNVDMTSNAKQQFKKEFG